MKHTGVTTQIKALDEYRFMVVFVLSLRSLLSYKFFLFHFEQKNVAVQNLNLEHCLYQFLPLADHVLLVVRLLTKLQ